MTFDIAKAAKSPRESHDCFRVDVVDHLVYDGFSGHSTMDPLGCALTGMSNVSISDLNEFIAYLDALPSFMPKFLKKDLVLPLEPCRNRGKPSEPPTLELKELPSHLKYAFLGENETLPVIISSKLTPVQEEKLLRVLREHKRAIGWTLADIRGISPSLCMHKQDFDRGGCKTHYRASTKIESKHEGGSEERKKKVAGQWHYLSALR